MYKAFEFQILPCPTFGNGITYGGIECNNILIISLKFMSHNAKADEVEMQELKQFSKNRRNSLQFRMSKRYAFPVLAYLTSLRAIEHPKTGTCFIPP